MDHLLSREKDTYDKSVTKFRKFKHDTVLFGFERPKTL